MNTTYTMKVICKGNRIQEWLNDELVIDTTLDQSASTWLASGGIGIRPQHEDPRGQYQGDGDH